MSIHPEYAEALMSGVKKVEFRRVAPKEPVRYVVVYATKPVGAILGVLQIAFVDHDAPERLWDKYSGVGGISNDKFFRYFEGRSSGTAMVVKSARRCKVPLPLASMGRSLKPPQSFTYLDATTFGSIAAS